MGEDPGDVISSNNLKDYFRWESQPQPFWGRVRSQDVAGGLYTQVFFGMFR